MNASAIPLGAAAGAAADTRDTALCAHCAEPLAGIPQAAASEHAGYCCNGCAAAALWIAEARLGDYYRLRSEPAGRVDTAHEDYRAFDREDVLAEHAHAVPGGRGITLLTDGMRCAACAWLIDRALSRMPGVLDAGANAVTGRIRISWDPARTRLSTLLRQLAALGYRASLATGERVERERRRQRNRDLLRLGIAGLGAMQAMMLAEALYLDFGASMPLPTRDFLRWVTLLVSTPVVYFAGWPFIAGAWRELAGRRPGMDVLIAGSTLLAWGASAVETVRGGPHVWYDAAVMFVFLLLAARMLEQRARRAAGARVETLSRARPAFASRERADGVCEEVPLAELAVGDVVRVAVGGVVPADGELLAPARFEEALLSGESAPVLRDAGEPAWAGAVCRQQPARLRVLRTGPDTRLSQLSRLVEAAQAQRPPLVQLGERLAHRFVAGLLVAAVVVYLGWRIHDPSRAFEVTLALLVISCPCALALAMPAALTVAQGALARIGVLAIGANALERLAAVTDVVFDKTGTLGDGRPGVQAVEARGLPGREALLLAAALERDAGHPLGHAFAQAAAQAEGEGDAHADLQAADIRVYAGAGVAGTVGGRRWRLGRADFAAGGPAHDDAAVWLAGECGESARFSLREAHRPDAAGAVAGLAALGLRVHLCSGDARGPVDALAAALRIGSVLARQSPEDKLAFVRGLQRDGRVVAMVGDGINDGPVLAGADVSIAMAEGAPLAQRAADLVLASPSLARIPEAVAIARRTRRIVRQNLAWATGYNLAALPLAAAGLVTPWVAALGMALSSLLVLGNALRLSPARPGRRPAVRA